MSIYQYSKNYTESKSDVAIVLGAGTSNGELSLVYQERINHAIYLFDSNKIDNIIFTGGFGKGESISDSQVAMNYAIKNGIPQQNILIEEKSTITYENLVKADSIMDNHKFNSALIVSDPYHMKRSMAISLKIGINAKSSPTQTSRYQSWSTKIPFLFYESFYYNIDLVLGHI